MAAEPGNPSGRGEGAPRRRPILQDIANEAGVSKGLASMILNGAPGPSASTTARVLEISERLGYRADRTATLLAKRRSRLLGVTVIPSNVFHGELTEEIESIAESNGYEIVVGTMTGTRDERRMLETLIDFRCEALLLIGIGMPAAQLAPIVAGVPTVCIGRRIDLPDVDVVRCDDERGVTQVVDHLVALGHRRIVHVDGGTGAIAQLRRRVYRATMRRHGLADAVLSGGLTEAEGSAAIEAPGALDGVTAIAAFNDRTAIGILDTLARRGTRVPKDLSVVGYDDSLQARHALIDLTTVDQSAAEQARIAVQAVIERLEGDGVRRRETVLPPRLIVRGTTGPAPEVS